MKKILFSLVALMCTMSMTAQVMKIKRDGTVVKTYKLTEADEVVFEEGFFHPGNFSVASGKTVKFTKSNLYWDGSVSAFKFEDKPTDYPNSRTASHIGHFFWGSMAGRSYSLTYNDSWSSASDKFFADGSDAAHKLTVEGKSGLYILSKAEWEYLFNTRPNAANLRKFPVTVYDGSKYVANCLVIAPDGATLDTNKASYTLDELDELGFVCLPPAGSFQPSLTNQGIRGYYWSSSQENAKSCYILSWVNTTLYTPGYPQSAANSLRAVRANN